jgi:hypothetical protein
MGSECAESGYRIGQREWVERVGREWVKSGYRVGLREWVESG